MLPGWTTDVPMNLVQSTEEEEMFLKIISNQRGQKTTATPADQLSANYKI
jgi:hypothetical protein